MFDAAGALPGLNRRADDGVVMTEDQLMLRAEEEKLALARALLDRVRSQVRYADVLVEEITKVEYTRLLGGEEVLKPFSRRSAVQLRLVGDEGRHLAVSLGALPAERLDDAVARALTLLMQQEADPGYGLAPIPHRERVRYGLSADVDLSTEALTLSFDTLRSEVDELCRRATDQHPGLTASAELWCYAQVEEKAILDTEGLCKIQVLPSTFLQMVVQVRDAATGRLSRQRTRIGDVRPLGHLFDSGDPRRGLRADFAENLGDCARRAVLQQRGRRLDPQELGRVTHYVLAPSAMVFVHEAEGHNFEADIVREGGSGLFHADGRPSVEPLGSPWVDLYDGQIRRPDGTFAPEDGFGTHFIDDEGVEVQPVRLVERGHIVAKLHNRETAHHFGEAPNGRGFSELGDRRLVRMTNTYLHPSDDERWFGSVEELVREVPFGVWLEGSMGGAVSRDGMSTTIQFGRLIVDGRITDEVLMPSNLSVVTKGSLLGVEGFAGPVRCDDPGFCGKGQTKTVTDGGPITLIRASPAITLGF